MHSKQAYSADEITSCIMTLQVLLLLLPDQVIHPSASFITYAAQLPGQTTPTVNLQLCYDTPPTPPTSLLLRLAGSSSA
jgi:hypothetical protein